jgi:peptide/nickel transport system substrate-binding protein
LRSAAALVTLAAPRIARSDASKHLRFVPTSDLVILDPVFTGARPTRNHGYLVFDTLYGLDENFAVRPQMAVGHSIEDAGKRWTITLRDRLRFHDGETVRARDVAASVRRFCGRDGFGRLLMAVTDELSTPDDRTIVFRLKKPFPHLAQALAGSTVFMPCVMPERLAATDPFKAVTEMVGSGPFRFLASEHEVGKRTVYERFADYVPAGDGEASFLAGPKRTWFDRVEWISIPDPSTVAGALRTGEIDWWDVPPADLRAELAGDENLRLATSQVQRAMCVMRFNHLLPPFDNPAVRQAVLGAVNQADAMQSINGADRSGWHDQIGLFCSNTPLANDAGIEVMSTPRDYAKVKRNLTEAGYRGETVVALNAADSVALHAVSLVGADELRRGGMEVDVQSMDFATLIRRRGNRGTPDKGGWNVFFAVLDNSSSFVPAANPFLRCDGLAAFDGWPTSPRIEELRQAWLDAVNLDEERRICREMQTQFWRDVPYVPMGEYTQWTCFRATLTSVPKGFALFYGVRPA